MSNTTPARTPLARAGAKQATHGLGGLTFILPNFAGFMLFTLLPVAASFVLAFVEWDILTAPRWVGVANFTRLFHDRYFWKYLCNTLFLMLGIPVSMMGSLVLAVVLNQRLRGITFFRTVFFLPTVAAGIALLILWKWIYNPDFGLLNSLLAGIGIRGPRWLEDVHWVKPAIMIMSIWTGVGGYNMILYLAALQNVNPELYEAAEIDGAAAWNKFWAITWPMVSPTTFFIFTMSMIRGFQGSFNSVYILTGGGPAGASTTLSYYIYQNAFVWFRMGYASAISWFLFAVILAITLINWRYGGRAVTYD